MPRHPPGGRPQPAAWPAQRRCLLLAVMQKNGLNHLASNDANFDACRGCSVAPPLIPLASGQLLPCRILGDETNINPGRTAPCDAPCTSIPRTWHAGIRTLEQTGAAKRRATATPRSSTARISTAGTSAPRRDTAARARTTSGGSGSSRRRHHGTQDEPGNGGIIITDAKYKDFESFLR